MNKHTYILLAAMTIACFPQTVFAASTDPAILVKNVANGIINFLMIVSPSIGTVAIMTLGVMYKLTNQSGKKSEYKHNMKETFIIVAVVMSAGGIMKWFLGLLG